MVNISIFEMGSHDLLHFENVEVGGGISNTYSDGLSE